MSMVTGITDAENVLIWKANCPQTWVNFLFFFGNSCVIAVLHLRVNFSEAYRRDSTPSHVILLNGVLQLWKQANAVDQRYLQPDPKSLVILQRNAMTWGKIKCKLWRLLVYYNRAGHFCYKFKIQVREYLTVGGSCQPVPHRANVHCQVALTWHSAFVCSVVHRFMWFPRPGNLCKLLVWGGGEVERQPCPIFWIWTTVPIFNTRCQCCTLLL